MPALETRIAVECAFFQARQVFRDPSPEAVADRMFDTLERARFPELAAKRLIKRLGRDKSQQLGFEDRLINDAIRNWRLYDADALIREGV